MNIHCINSKTLKEREIEIGEIIESNAEASEKKFLLEEAVEAITLNEDSQQQKGIHASTDTCWQKKGSGRAYNSLSGVASLIGQKTGKVLHHTIRSGDCRVCNIANRKGEVPRKHKCSKNWTDQQKLWSLTWLSR